MSKKYYAAVNQYGSPTSLGFANTWDVLVFNGRLARDAYVDAADDLATRAIARVEVIAYVMNTDSNGNSTQPKPFTNEYWGIVEDIPSYINPRPQSCIGSIAVCDAYDSAIRFYGSKHVKHNRRHVQ